MSPSAPGFMRKLRLNTISLSRNNGSEYLLAAVSWNLGLRPRAFMTVSAYALDCARMYLRPSLNIPHNQIAVPTPSLDLPTFSSMSCNICFVCNTADGCYDTSKAIHCRLKILVEFKVRVRVFPPFDRRILLITLIDENDLDINLMTLYGLFCIYN